MPGRRHLLVALTAAVLATGCALSPARALAAAPACDKATAIELVNDNDLNGFLLPDPVVQLLCGPFTGAGTQAMVVTIGAATCWSPQSWAVFRVQGDAWQLVQFEPAFLAAPLRITGTAVHEKTPVFRNGDPRCVPSGGTHSRVWRWNGTRFVPGPYDGAPARRTVATFYSPSRNVSCEMNDGRTGVGTYVYCQSMAHPHSVKMGLGGRLKICRSAKASTAQCLGNPGEHTPVLRYGHHVSLEHFRCRSARSGVTCVVIRTGKGFRIDRTGVRRVSR
jgi:hypothetical protein